MGIYHIYFIYIFNAVGILIAVANKIVTTGIGVS